jgi:hypothetical protein
MKTAMQNAKEERQTVENIWVCIFKVALFALLNPFQSYVEPRPTV